MDRVFFVKNGDLETVNKELESKKELAFIKGIYPVAESVSIAGGGAGYVTNNITGNVYAYVVIEYKYPYK